MSEHPNFTRLAALFFSQPEKHAKRLLGAEEFDTGASILQLVLMLTGLSEHLQEPVDLQVQTGF